MSHTNDVTIESCPVCDGEPRVLVVMQHPTMLRFTREILEREFGCWVATEMHAGNLLAAALVRLMPDLLVIDVADFPASRFAALAHFPPERIIVIGPEPDSAYREVALAMASKASPLKIEYLQSRFEIRPLQMNNLRRFFISGLWIVIQFFKIYIKLYATKAFITVV